MTTAPCHTLYVNGLKQEVQADENLPLLDVLRDILKLKGTKFGCGHNQCGACFVLLDGHVVASCDTPLWSATEKQITTVEGLGTENAPHRLQQAFVELQAAQCGYCTAGMLISACALLNRCPKPTAREVRQALDRNLCRCGSHNRIIGAVLQAADERQQ